jgi:N-carbamoyl-L-amino-acid hydrolase
VNRPYRRDAVAATVALLAYLERVWLEKEREGADLTITTGELSTDPKFHGPSKIAGETRFVIDIRSVSDDTMREVAAEARRAAQEIGKEYRVNFELGPTTDSLAAMMDPRLRSAFADSLPEPFEMPSGAGHDAVMFASLGIPTGMVFVRNEYGSHNPDEAMSLEDFAVGACALQHVLTHFPI